MTIKELAQTAIDVQNACNSSGVVLSLSHALPVLREAIPNQGTEFYNQHPIITLYLSKLASLNRTDCLCSDCLDAFGRAMDACEKLAGGVPELHSV